MRYRFTAELWDYTGEGSWHFVTLPRAVTDEVADHTGPRRGFGSVRVRATVGATSWATSIFPSKTEGYVLPVKRAVRVAERLEVGEPVDVELEIVDATPCP